MWASSAADVGKIIVAARRYRGLTQTELADAIGATQSWLSEVEQGKDTAQIGKVLGTLSYLGVRLNTCITPWSEPKSGKPSRTVYRCRAFLTHMFGLIDRATNVETSGMP
jgi:HTH-type transcriptional regulator/antitoxin HipB